VAQQRAISSPCKKPGVLIALGLYGVEQMLEHTGRLLPQIFLGQAKAIYRKYATGWISHVAARHDARHAFKGKPLTCEAITSRWSQSGIPRIASFVPIRKFCIMCVKLLAVSRPGAMAPDAV
jgi:hypothetical protein